MNMKSKYLFALSYLLFCNVSHNNNIIILCHGMRISGLSLLSLPILYENYVLLNVAIIYLLRECLIPLTIASLRHCNAKKFVWKISKLCNNNIIYTALCMFTLYICLLNQ